MTRKAIESVRATLSWVDSHAVSVLFSAVIVLLLLGFARLYTVTETLKHEQAVTCRLRMAGRANTNTHERVPLRAALKYLAVIVVKSAQGQPDRVKRDAALMFGRQFEAYAALVEPLPNPKC